MKNISSFLPSKQFLRYSAPILILFIVGIGIYIYTSYYKTQKNTLGNALVTTEGDAVTVKDLINSDSDGDGLYDWEEHFWGMDPENPDTNGDGVKDGAEVDAIRKKENPDMAETNQTADNTTKQLSQEIFTIAATLAQAGKITDEQAIEIANKSVESLKEQDIFETKYKAEDIKSSGAMTAAATQKYLKSIDTVFKKYPLGSDTSIVIMTTAINKDDPTILKRLDPLARMYENLVRELLLVPVPERGRAFHAALINSVYNIQKGIEGMKLALTDPIKSIPAMVQYQQGLTFFAQGLDLIVGKKPTL